MSWARAGQGRKAASRRACTAALAKQAGSGNAHARAPPLLPLLIAASTCGGPWRCWVAMLVWAEAIRGKGVRGSMVRRVQQDQRSGLRHAARARLDREQARAPVAVLLAVDARHDALGDAHVVAALGEAHDHHLALRGGRVEREKRWGDACGLHARVKRGAPSPPHPRRANLHGRQPVDGQRVHVCQTRSPPPPWPLHVRPQHTHTPTPWRANLHGRQPVDGQRVHVGPEAVILHREHRDVALWGGGSMRGAWGTRRAWGPRMRGRAHAPMRPCGGAYTQTSNFAPRGPQPAPLR